MEAQNEQRTLHQNDQGRGVSTAEGRGAGKQGDQSISQYHSLGTFHHPLPDVGRRGHVITLGGLHYERFSLVYRHFNEYGDVVLLDYTSTFNKSVYWIDLCPASRIRLQVSV